MKGEQKRRVLGKGLSSLIPDTPAGDPLSAAVPAAPAAPEGTALQVLLDAIQPNPRQPRQHFAEADIDELADSIRQSGVLQPLLCRKEKNGRFTLIAGERRWRAARRVGLKTVPVILKEVPDDRLLEFALIENIQRDDLNPIETGKAFRSLVRDLGLTQAEVAQRIGKPRSSVANFLRLLDLPAEVQALLEEGALEMGHGKALAGLDDAALQVKLARQAANSRWSVREIENRVARLAEPPHNEGEGQARRDPNVAAAEKTASRALGSVVKIQIGRRGSGRIEIRFADAEDLDRVYRLLLRAGGATSVS